MMAAKRKTSVQVRVILFLAWTNRFAFSRNRGTASSFFSATANESAQLSTTFLASFKDTPCLLSRGGSLPENELESASTMVFLSKDSKASGSDDASHISAMKKNKDGTSEIGGLENKSNSARATELRLAGKEAHDRGDFIVAAEVFQRAANALGAQASSEHVEEYATCRLHEALCYLKSEHYNECLSACSAVLEESGSHMSAVRARAYHRRAKAKVALKDRLGALQDARSAAFLGDRKAVVLYGRLMRQNTSSVMLAPGTSCSEGGLDSYSSPSAALFESLLSKSSKNYDQTDKRSSTRFGSDDFGNSSFLDMLGTGGGGLAKSVISSLGKRLEDESTLTSIATFLQATDKIQMQQYASMAGVAIPEAYLDRIEGVCHGLTPRKIKAMVLTTKGMVYVTRILRGISKIIQKYRSLLVALALFQWTKSAIMRPIPIDRAAAKRAAKAELKDAMRANRPKETA